LVFAARWEARPLPPGGRSFFFLLAGLNLEIGTPAAFGFAGWNGRSLTDNAPDVMFSLGANTPVRLGIGRESVTSKPSGRFPYVRAVAAEKTEQTAA
jgi:hypothetical protein